MNIRDLAKKLAIENKMPHADRYDLFLREFDNSVEVIGWMQDPTIDVHTYQNREMLIPKRWVTIGVLDADMKVKVGQ